MNYREIIKNNVQVLLKEKEIKIKDKNIDKIIDIVIMETLKQQNKEISPVVKGLIDNLRGHDINDY